jgi:hypothetical protein
MFQSIWTIFRELMLVLTKVTLLKILPLKFSVKILSVSWFRLCVYPVLCGVRLKRHLGRLRHRQEINIKIDIKELGWEGVD